MRFAPLGLAVALVACQPSTTYNRGVDMSFHPSGKADAQQRLVASAVELKADADQGVVKEAGGLYLGELEVVGEKAGALYMTKEGGGNLAGRVSLEAASRGATHFFLASSRVEQSIETHQHGSGNTSSTPVSRTHARFVLFRVERADWGKLPAGYRPEGGATSWGEIYVLDGGAAPPAAPGSTSL